MTIKEEQDDIIEEFKDFDDWMDKYQLLIDMGNELPEIDEKFKQPDFLIEGCQSRVWVHADFKDNVVKLQAESDTVIVKGLIALLVRVLNNRTPQEILDANLYFIDEIGLKDNLSPTRSNGLVSMINQIKNYALAFKLQEEEK